jgi:tRNA (mo5U34)-methyltransferase
MTSPATQLSSAEIEQRLASVEHWHHIISFAHGLRSPGVYDPADLFERLGLVDLRGQRVLDVGTRDGYFSFRCEQLGADVVAIDNCPPDRTGFPVAKEILGSRVEYRVANVYDLTPQDFGTFDVILFLGVLYHLRHPLLALDRLRALCRGTVFVESLVCDQSFFLSVDRSLQLAEVAPGLVDLPVAQFLPYGKLHRDWTNKWAPNVACLRALIEDAQFAPEVLSTWGDRALVRALITEDSELRRRKEHDSGMG